MSDQTVTTTGRTFILTRTFDAPRALVFAAYSSCEHLRQWWGPRSWPMVECSIDFRVVKKVMFSAAQAGYTNVSFAVTRTGGD